MTTSTSTPDTGTSSTANGAGTGGGKQRNGHRGRGGGGDKDAAAHQFHNPLSNTQCSEVNPSIYEELKLGQEGAGFKKLVP